MLPPLAVSDALPAYAIDAGVGTVVTVTVGNARTVADPVDTVCVTALVLLALTFPLAPFVASDFSRTYTVVADTVVPLLGMVTVPA